MRGSVFSIFTGTFKPAVAGVVKHKLLMPWSEPVIISIDSLGVRFFALRFHDFPCPFISVLPVVSSVVSLRLRSILVIRFVGNFSGQCLVLELNLL